MEIKTLDTFPRKLSSRAKWTLFGLIVAGVGLFYISRFVLLVAPSPATPRSAPKTAPVAEVPAAKSAEEQLLERFRRLLGTDQQQLSLEMEQLADKDPLLAMKLAQQLGNNARQRRAIIAIALRGWTFKDPAAAWQWVLKESSKFEVPGGRTLDAVALGAAAESNPQLVFDWIRAVLENPAITDLYVPKLAADGAQGLILAGHQTLARESLSEWADHMPKDLLGEAAGKVAFQQNEITPAQTGEWLQSLPPSNFRNHALGVAAERWARTEPAAAMNWVAAHKSDDGRDTNLQTVFMNWAQKDLADAVQWFAEREGDPSLDQLIGGLVGGFPLLREKNPEVAIVMAESVTNPELRFDCIESVLEAWSKKDPNAAVRYVAAKQDVTPVERQRLLEALQRPASPFDAPLR